MAHKKHVSTVVFPTKLGKFRFQIYVPRRKPQWNKHMTCISLTEERWEFPILIDGVEMVASGALRLWVKPPKGHFERARAFCEKKNRCILL